MRPFLIAGNWKMNLNRAEAVGLAGGLASRCAAAPGVSVAVCPPSVYLDAVGQALRGSAVSLGAQNMYHAAKGAFTGEISAAMLIDLGCRHVILGHSERRRVLGEPNAEINKKVKAALTAGLTPIVCVGETLQEREANQTLDIVREQLFGSLAGLSPEQAAKLVIAYEPVWAIGTGVTALPHQAEEVHAALRGLLAQRYNEAVAKGMCLQYGGSVTPETAPDLLQQENIDGALVGGASLKLDQFLQIVQTAVECTRHG